MSEKKYNPLPEGYEGDQKRLTEFASPEEKAAHDAPGLIELTRQTYGKQTVTVAEALDLRRRGNAVSGDDDAEAPLLRRAIAIELTKKSDWEAWFDGLEISNASREKLRAMLSPEAYALSLSAYRETGGTKEAPSLDAIRSEIMTWSLDRLVKELEMRENPIFLIVSDKSFQDGIKAMNYHKNMHYRNEKENQQEASVASDKEFSYKSVPRAKGCVIITEGVPHPKKLTGVPIQARARRDHLTAEYGKAGMRHIYGVEMQALLQRSLIEASKANDNTLIVDGFERGEDVTETFIKPEFESKLVTFSSFGAAGPRAVFSAVERDYHHTDGLSGRATSQVMEF